MSEDFDKTPDRAPSADIRWRNAWTAGTSAQRIPELVSEIYDEAPAPVRTKLLEYLLRPVGPLALVTIATGAFAHLLHRLTRDATPISSDDAARITSDHVLELACYVEQCSPHALERIGSLIADSQMGVATMSGSALLLALGARSTSR
ncbi:hypothetical protein SBBP1_1090003 [Burkholderiales bacterium]|nr:hypothetical protein SBBP1_1090003 [Burkholderiales bacterium]